MKSKKNLIWIVVCLAIVIVIGIIIFIMNGSKTYTIKFDSNGGTLVESQKVKKGDKVTRPTTPTKEGYAFDEWQLDNQKYDFNLPVEKDITLVAKWTLVQTSDEEVTISFDSAGGSAVTSIKAVKETLITKPSDPTRTGYVFKGWYLNDELYDFSKPVSESVTLVANWEEEKKNTNTNTNTTKPTTNTNTNTNTNTTTNTTPVTYTVTFNSDGGSSVASQTVNKDGKATKPTNPTKDGYTFKEWQLNGKTYNFSSKVTSNITLKAVWTEVAKKSYTIKFTAIDEYSPDRRVAVYEDGTKISVSKVMYTDGVLLCSGSNMVVNKNDISGENSFLIELKDGSKVTAKVS